MDEDRFLSRMFDGFDEKDLSKIIRHLGRRMLLLRATSTDAGFWFNMLLQFNKWLDCVPDLSRDEVNMILKPPPGVNGTIRASIMMKQRTGMRLKEAKDIVDDWLKRNGKQV